MPIIPKHRLRLIGVAILFVALLTAFFVVIRKWGVLFKNPEELRQLVRSTGVWSPLAIIGLQLLQIVFAPLPGNITAFAAGYALGFWPTILYLMLGVLGGSAVAFLIARLFGRRILHLFVPPDALRRFDQQVIQRGTFFLFLLLLVPNPLGDWIYYLAGITAIPFPLFLTLVLIARLPSNIIECGIGASAINFGWREWLIFALLVTGLSALYLLNRNRIEKLLARISSRVATR